MSLAIWHWKGEEAEGEVYRITIGSGEMFQARIYGRWYGQQGVKVRGVEIERGVYHTIRDAKNRIVVGVNR